MAEQSDLGERVFQALSHPLRRRILTRLAVSGLTPFSELLKAVAAPDSPTLSYHLRCLGGFLSEEGAGYGLTDLGREAYGVVSAAASLEGRLIHMGMSLTEEEHERWHREHRELTPEEHAELMRGMGIGAVEGRRWHEKHGLPGTEGLSAANPFAVGGAFLEYCVGMGWMVREGGRARYLVNPRGRLELKRFSITV